MDASTLTKFRRAIAQVFGDWEQLPSAISDFRIVGVIDTERDRYLLEHVESEGAHPIARTLAYLEVCEGKIWVQVDNTDRGIAAQLVSAGVPKEHIVLGFYSPAMRQLGEFAVA